MPKNYRFIEPPDSEFTVDFAGACSVRIKIEKGKNGTMIHVLAKGLDDRATILVDEYVKVPAPDDRD